MKLLIDVETKEAYESLEDDHEAVLPEFTLGENVPISVALLTRIFRPYNSLIFNALAASDWDVTVGLGGFMLSTSGTFPLTFGAETSPILCDFDATADEIEDSLNAIPGIVTAGGVTVAGVEGNFTITFNTVGVRANISSNASDLVPLSVIQIAEAVTGSVSVREVQTLRIKQDVGASEDLTTDSSSPAVTLTVLVQGDSTHNHSIKVVLPSNRWGGSWLFTVNGNTSAQIDFAPNAAQLQSKIEGITGVGTGNVGVTQNTEDEFTVTFKGALANLAIAGILSDGTLLKVVSTKSGVLDLTTVGAQFLIPPERHWAVVQFEVEATPDSGLPEKILQRDVILNRAVLP